MFFSALKKLAAFFYFYRIKISNQIPMPANRINLAVKMQVDKFRKVKNGTDLTAVRKMMLHI